MNEVLKAQVEQALTVLRPLALDMRSRGFDANLWVEVREGDYTVEIRVNVPAKGIPIETAA